MSSDRPGLQSPAVTGPQYLRSGKVREIFEIDDDTYVVVRENDLLAVVN